MYVCAEGVESLDQARYLRNRECDLLQGYFFAPALPAEEVTRLLDRRTPVTNDRGSEGAPLSGPEVSTGS